MTTPVNPDRPALRRAIELAEQGKSLDRELSTAAFLEMISGMASDEEMRSLLLALRSKGETADEISGAVHALRGAMRPFPHDAPHLLVDTCGTGGGGITTINISTAAAFVAAADGVPVAKHGNRSHTSRSGSADVLEALRIPIDLAMEPAARSLRDHDLVFLFAPAYHTAMKHVASVRRALGVRTIMNLLGPLANPAGVQRQVVGVADRALAPAVAGALARSGALHAMVVHADVGMDEISPLGPSSIWEVLDGEVRESSFDPASVGLESPTLEGLEGGTPEENAGRIEALFERPAVAPSALRNAVLLNAAAAIAVSATGTGWTDSVERARTALNDGRAAAKLEALRLNR